MFSSCCFQEIVLGTVVMESKSGEAWTFLFEGFWELGLRGRKWWMDFEEAQHRVLRSIYGNAEINPDAANLVVKFCYFHYQMVSLPPFYG